MPGFKLFYGVFYGFGGLPDARLCGLSRSSLNAQLPLDVRTRRPKRIRAPLAVRADDQNGLWEFNRRVNSDRCHVCRLAGPAALPQSAPHWASSTHSGKIPRTLLRAATRLVLLFSPLDTGPDALWRPNIDKRQGRFIRRFRP